MMIVNQLSLVNMTLLVCQPQAPCFMQFELWFSLFPDYQIGQMLQSLTTVPSVIYPSVKLRASRHDVLVN